MPEESSLPSDQISERLVIKAKYNEPFPIPVPTIKPTIRTATSFNKDRFGVDVEEDVFNIEIEGHPGYGVEVRTEPHTIDRVTTTTLRGAIVFYPLGELIFNPFQLQTLGQRHQKYFLPWGPY